MKLRLKDSFNMLPVGTKSEPPALAVGKGATGESTPEITTSDTTATSMPPAYTGGSDKTSAVYKVIGQPEDIDGAKEVALDDHYVFQWWILRGLKPTAKFMPPLTQHEKPANVIPQADAYRDAISFS